MATAAVGCSLPSAWLNVQVARSSTIASSCKTCGSLPWDPLQRYAMLGSCSYLSSSSSGVVSQKFMRCTPVNRRITFLRASINNESKQGIEIGEEDRGSKSSDMVNYSGDNNALRSLLRSAAKPTVVLVMMALLLAQPTDDAFAASTGGRVGGRVFSKPSNPSRAYSGGGGGGGRSYSGGVYTAPPIYGSPYGFSPFGFSPFYGGGYGGGLFLGPSLGFGGGGTIVLAMIAFATLSAISRFVRDRFRGGDEDDRFDD